MDLLARLCGKKGSKLKEIKKELEQVAGCTDIDVYGEDLTTENPDGDRPGKQVHFVAHCEKSDQAEMCRIKLKEALVEFHECFYREVMGSLEIRGFPSSWG